MATERSDVAKYCGEIAWEHFDQSEKHEQLWRVVFDDEYRGVPLRRVCWYSEESEAMQYVERCAERGVVAEVTEYRKPEGVPTPVDLASVRRLIPSGPAFHQASALLDLNAPLTATDTILEGLRDLAVEVGPLDESFFQAAINERHDRHLQFIDDLMSGKLDESPAAKPQE